jgi:RNA polymerase sigma-70 factor, ECF subfamily
MRQTVEAPEYFSDTPPAVAEIPAAEVDEPRARSCGSTGGEEAVMRRVQSGDRDGLADLFERYSRPVLRLATRMLRNSADAQEVVQEVFLYIHRKSDRFDPARGSVGTWVLQVAYTRSLNRREQLYSPLSSARVPVENLDEFADREAGAERTMEKLCARQIVDHLLTQLTEDQSETLRLYFVEGYTLREISRLRNQAPGNTRHHYHRAIEKLRKVVAEEGGAANGRALDEASTAETRRTSCSLVTDSSLMHDSGP